MGMSDTQYAACTMDYVASLYSQASKAEVIIGDKCPPAFTRLDDINNVLMSRNKSLNIIWTVRHPYDQALSWIERFQKNSITELSFYSQHKIANQYTLEQAVELIFNVWIDQQNTMNAYKGYTVTYEELTKSPARQIQKLHEWLGIEFNKSQLEIAFNDAVIGGDPKFNRTSEIHTSSRFRYKKESPAARALLEKVADKINLLPHMGIYGYHD